MLLGQRPSRLSQTLPDFFRSLFAAAEEKSEAGKVGKLRMRLPRDAERAGALTPNTVHGCNLGL